MRQSLCVLVTQPGGDPSSILDMLETLITKRVWERLGTTFVDFITTPFGQGGIGWSIENLQAVTQMRHRHESEDPQVSSRMSSLRRDIDHLLLPVVSRRGRPRKGTIEQAQSHSGRAYYLQRLAHERPDLAEKVFRGEISTNAASIEAGFRKRIAQIAISSPADVARSLARHLDVDERRELIKALLALEGE